MAGLSSLFGAAVANSANSSKKTSKGQLWMVGVNPEVETALSELTTLNAEAKAIEAKMGLQKAIVKNFAETQWLQSFAQNGVQPDSPMAVQNSKGQKATFVVQDKLSTAQISAEQQSALSAILGEDAVSDLIVSQAEFGFDPDIMALPGVAAVIEKALVSAVQKMTKGDAPLLTEEQAGLLIKAKVSTTVKRGTLEQLALICGKKLQTLSNVVQIFGSGIVRYVKV